MVRSKLQGMSDHTCQSPSKIRLDGYSVAYFNCITTPEAPYHRTSIKGAAHMCLINIVDIHTSMKPVWVPTLTVVHFECGDVISIWDGIIFDFYARLSRYPITCWTIKLLTCCIHPTYPGYNLWNLTQKYFQPFCADLEEGEHDLMSQRQSVHFDDISIARFVNTSYKDRFRTKSRHYLVTASYLLWCKFMTLTTPTY